MSGVTLDELLKEVGIAPSQLDDEWRIGYLRIYDRPLGVMYFHFCYITTIVTTVIMTQELVL